MLQNSRLPGHISRADVLTMIDDLPVKEAGLLQLQGYIAERVAGGSASSRNPQSISSQIHAVLAVRVANALHYYSAPVAQSAHGAGPYEITPVIREAVAMPAVTVVPAATVATSEEGVFVQTTTYVVAPPL